MSRTFTFTELVAMAAESKQTIETLVKVGMQLEEKDRREQAARRSSPEETAKLTTYLEGLHAQGKLSLNTPIEDILADAGVPRRQGTSSVVRFNRKRLLAA